MQINNILAQIVRKVASKTRCFLLLLVGSLLVGNADFSYAEQTPEPPPTASERDENSSIEIRPRHILSDEPDTGDVLAADSAENEEQPAGSAESTSEKSAPSSPDLFPIVPAQRPTEIAQAKPALPEANQDAAEGEEVPQLDGERLPQDIAERIEAYAEIYNAIPFSRAEYDANPSYRHEATMEILFGELRPKVIHRHDIPPELLQNLLAPPPPFRPLLVPFPYDPRFIPRY